MLAADKTEWTGVLSSTVTTVGSCNAFLLEKNVSEATEIRAILESRACCIRDKDAGAVLQFYASDVVNFDLAPPLAYRVGTAFDQLEIRAANGLAVAFGFLHLTGKRTDDSLTNVWARITVTMEKRSGDWKIIHEHQSFPTMMDGTEMSATGLQP